MSTFQTNDNHYTKHLNHNDFANWHNLPNNNANYQCVAATINCPTDADYTLNGTSNLIEYLDGPINHNLDISCKYRAFQCVYTQIFAANWSLFNISLYI